MSVVAQLTDSKWKAASPAQQSWGHVARRLGLSQHPGALRLSGWSDDRFVLAECEKGRFTVVASLLWPPLDLGLLVHAGPL